MDQTVINLTVGTALVIFGAALSVAGWMLRTIWEALGNLQHQDTRLAEKVGSIETLVLGEYIKRHEVDDRFEKLSSAIFAKLDKISDKIDRKADK